MDSDNLKIRAQKLGINLRETRISKGQSIDQLSEATGISTNSLESYEEGELSPSLPEIELLAYRLGVTLDRLIEGEISSGDESKQIDPQRFLSIRQRIIGTLLRKARVEADLSAEELSRRCDIEIDALNSYEMGVESIPIPLFERLITALNVSIRDFRDKHGPVGEWLTIQQQVAEYLELPSEIRAFVAMPVNIPYLELAIRISEMSVEKLRAVAEGLLEITL